MLRIVFGILVVLVTWAAVLVFSLPLWIAIAVTVAAAVVAAALFAYARYRAKVAAGEIEKSLQSQSEAQASIRPDQQAEIDAMQAEFQKAVSALKSSKLARAGSDALAVLPWYMIIGPPGAGKSTALRNSGLQFPYLSARGGGVRGVGGTRNCEWWLTNESVILDTAGRYTTEDEDHDEWTQFLDMLARTRSKKPINGLIVAVSVGDLGGESEESTAELARRIRERMDEVMSRLQVVLPAYLLFTKCDLVPGFVEIFSDLRKQDRGQLWGFTLPAERHETPPGEVFTEKFDELAEVIERRALARLGDERNLVTRERIFQFPQQFEALRSNLATFVEQLFAENVYQDTPLMRGIYFTSGTQEGRTIDRVMGAMAQAFGVRPRFGDGEAPVEAKSYFLRDVFKQVIFPDQALAVRSAKALRRDQLNRYGIAAAAIAAAIALFAFPMRAYVLNRSLVRTTGELVESTAGILNAADGSNPRLDAIEPLRERLELLMQFEAEGAPWSMRLGMYQGSQLLPAVRRLYATSVRRLVIQPVFTLEQEEMAEFAKRYASTLALPDEADYPAYYDRLKLHLLLSSPRAASEPRPSEADQRWLADRIAERWTGDSHARDGAVARSVHANAALFAKLMADDGMLALPRHDETVKQLRRVLGRLPFTSLAVNKLVREVEPKGLDLTLPIMLGEPVPMLQSAVTIKGAFTRKGYEEVVRPRLEDPASVLEPWVLARGDSADYDERLAEAAAQLRTRYFELYIDAWKGFLDDLKVDMQASGGAMGGLQDLTRGEPSPYERLFQAVAQNTRIGGMSGALDKAGEGLMAKLAKTMGPKSSTVNAAAGATAAARGREVGPAEVERAFAGLVAFAVAPDALTAAAGAATGSGGAAKRALPIDLYLEQLTFVRDALRATLDGSDPGQLVGATQTARTRVRALVDSAETGWRPRLQALLWPPIDSASRASAREAAAGAATQWCATVAEPFRRTLAGRYPFNRNGADAALADVSEFFRPGGVVWGFYDASLRTDIERSGQGFKFAKHLGGVSGFRGDLLGFLTRAQDVTTVLFPAGAAEPAVQLSMKVRPSSGVAVVYVEIDGQKFDYRNGPEEWHRITWPMQGKNPGASIRVRSASGREEVVQQEGEWGLYRLIESGAVKPGLSGRDLTVTWNLPSLATAVTVDVRASRTDSPFFGVQRGKKPGALMAPFRAGVSPPGNIGKGGEACN